MYKILLFIIISSRIILSQWQSVGQMPYPVAGAEAISPDGVNIYLFGGYSDSTQSVVNWIQAYNTYSGNWSFTSTMKANRSGLLVSRSDRSIYYFGGVADTTDSANVIEKLDLPNNPEIFDYNPNFNRINAAGIIIDKVFYIFGGNPYNNPGTIPYIFEYDVSNKQIIYTDDTLFAGEYLPEQQMAAEMDGNIFIFGGVQYGVSKKIYSFNILEDQFTMLGITLKEPRANGEAVRDETTNRIYIIGGYNESNAALNSVEILSANGPGYSISEGDSLNQSREDFAAVYCSNSIYVFGGYDASGKMVRNIERISTALNAVNNVGVENINYKLYQNYPNPFNPSTNIQVSLKHDSFVKLNIYSIEGRHIRSLIGEELSKGNHNFVWDGKDDNGKNVSSGVYFYRLISGNFKETKKMVLLR